MKILIVSTLKRKVTPQETASRSRIIYELASGLAKKRHDVSLLGTGDSHIPGVHTIPVIPKAWVDLPAAENPFFQETATMIMLAKTIVKIQHSFDVIHNHMYPEFFTPMIEAELHRPMVTTVHIQATDYIDQALSMYTKSGFVSISQAHRSMFRRTKIPDIIYNGIDTNLYTLDAHKENYLLWIGRLSKAKEKNGMYMDPKGVRWAIKLARLTGERLFLAGNVEDQAFFDRDVKPYLNDRIKWIGPVSPEQALTKLEIVHLMQKAKAFLMPINWQEPFGLVMAEAMACGTPVIGFDRGSVRELVEDGVTGFVVNPQEEVAGLQKALKKIATIKPLDCRQRVEKYFSVDRMVHDYEQLYHTIAHTYGTASPHTTDYRYRS